MTRARDLGIAIGDLPTGPLNAITDVPGVLVGHTTLIYDQPRVARTGVTMIVPRDGGIWSDHAFAAYHVYNGNGEMTGLPWIDESGMIGAPIGITNTHQVGVVRDAIIRYAVDRELYESFFLPVVAETYDGHLNDIGAFHVTTEHAIAAIDAARGGAVAEGNVGGGTGMNCHEFKGGIGTASRVAQTQSGPFTVGVLVQTNYGLRGDLRVDGVPVGRLIGPEVVPTPWPRHDSSSSIIVIIATDAPLLPVQCRRLAQRATTGLARVGGYGHNSSGDIFLAFATGNHLPAGPAGPYNLRMLPHEQIDPLFHGVAEATEEAILNALCAAETITGFQGRVSRALPHDLLREIMAGR
ncbi:P1 family peptidase [Oscillochloris sp. ZM17-4]|uniref:DmpA family aminopeptidase n=1 Tax=Oscillochloris sp. ZM17-4 TaxID=2866714 RepID=UPI001C7384E2|nr:P1 family peptidase [Oscillochloris sp. ZM17-4]MBX0326989.1 P1 family peptidase [Oscillochloris sp. ZM17-4]